MFRAVMSVSDKTGIVEFAKNLRTMFGNDLMLLSTGSTPTGTFTTLKDAKLEPTQIASFTGTPEVMGGRVKTIHPKLAGGILARRDVQSDLDELVDKLHSATIDLVCVNLYPFQATASKPGVTFQQLIENIDIGGPTLMRAAAKNFCHVLAVTSPSQYDDVLAQLRQRGGPTLQFRFELMYAAIRHTGDYDTAIANEMARWQTSNFDFERRPAHVCE